MYKTEKEIFSQYDALQLTYRKIMSYEKDFRAIFNEKRKEGLSFLGCGSSYSLCKSAAISAKMRLKGKINALAAGDMMINYQYFERIIKNTILVALSRSGNTSEVLMAVNKAREDQNSMCISICARENSELSKLSDLSIALPWAFDDSVCQTRTVTNLYLSNLLVIALMAEDELLVKELEMSIKAGSQYLESNKNVLKEIADANGWEKVIVLADSELEGVAEEGALAFNEICGVSSSYYHVLDVRHGPMVLVDNKTLVILACSPLDNLYQKALIKDLKLRGAIVLTVSSRDNETWGSDYNILVPKHKNYGVNGVPFIFVPQAISYYRALATGINPDKPQGLRPWISL